MGLFMKSGVLMFEFFAGAGMLGRRDLQEEVQA